MKPIIEEIFVIPEEEMVRTLASELLVFDKYLPRDEQNFPFQPKHPEKLWLALRDGEE